jgi:FAD/FMN-containing dehydrogenase
MMTTDQFETLRGSIAGQLHLPADSSYDESRKVFNAMHDKRPAVIVRCANTQDVATAVRFARQNRLLIAVRCGGHSVAGLSVCDQGVLIDLAGLKKIEVDPQAKTAVAGGGVLWGEFDAATQQHALHTPGGRVTTTGLGGFTTGGGYGWTSSRYGLACDNLISAEVVLSDGSVVVANEDQNADLFWGIRGGGGNFGIVTEFKFRLHPLGPMVLAGLALWPIESAAKVLRAWRDYVDSAPDELSTGCATITAPPEPFVPEHLRGQVVFGIVLMYVGDPAEGASIVQPLKDLAPAVDLIQPMPYTAFQALLDGAVPKGFRSYWRGEYMKNLSDGAMEAFVRHAPELTRASQPFTQVVVFRIGQGVAQTPDDATAFSHRDANYLFHPITIWEHSRDDDRLIAAGRECCNAMRPFSTGGAYLNFTPEDRVRDGYGEAKYKRLVALKDRYDPENLFRLNPNIAPSRQSSESALA